MYTYIVDIYDVVFRPSVLARVEQSYKRVDVFIR